MSVIENHRAASPSFSDTYWVLILPQNLVRVLEALGSHVTIKAFLITSMPWFLQERWLALLQRVPSER